MAMEAARRELQLPATFDVPDHPICERGYRAEARRTVGFDALDLDTALTSVRPFLDRTATGCSDPRS
jgi:hypothetical protein